MKKTNFLAVVTALTMLVGNAAAVPIQNVSAAYGTGNNIVENLDRGICAVNTGKGMMVSWRFNADDPDNTEFKLYRGNDLIYTSGVGKATSYLDAQSNAKSKYRVDTLVNGSVISSDSCNLTSGNAWLDIPLDVPQETFMQEILVRNSGVQDLQSPHSIRTETR